MSMKNIDSDMIDLAEYVIRHLWIQSADVSISNIMFQFPTIHVQILNRKFYSTVN